MEPVPKPEDTNDSMETTLQEVSSSKIKHGSKNVLPDIASKLLD